MKMKKSAYLLFFAVFLYITALAQTVQEGVNHIYAQRYQSAKSLFEKLRAINPNNIEATYWLGQNYIAMGDVSAAATLYQSALAANGNAPLVLAGMGHVELLQGNSSSAHQRFEAAITTSHGKKGNDQMVLNAVGRANIDAYTDAKKLGDLDYAIAKLNEAVTVNPNLPDAYVNLGNAYRKKHDGSNAVLNYRKAVQINPSYAIAYYRIAELFKTQTTYGQGNWDVVLENLNNATTADPKFAPAYFELFYYNLLYKQDFTTAENYANKYIANSDPSVENDYLKAETLFVEKKYSEAIAVAKNIVSQTGNKANPRVYRLLGYSYLGSKDTATACDAVTTFFTKAKEEEVIGQDFILHASSCGRNNPDLVRSDVTKAVNMDSDIHRQLAMLNEAIKNAHDNNQRILEAELRLVSYQLRSPGNTSATELISYIAVPFYLGGAFDKADSAAKAYITLAPDSIYGYLWSARALARIDSNMTQGLAIPQYEQLLRVAGTDKVKYKNYGVEAAGQLAGYYVNIKNDREKGIQYLTAGLEFDPTVESFKTNLEKLKKVNTAPQRQPTGTKTKTSKGK